jgi:hypothetical protein
MRAIAVTLAVVGCLFGIGVQACDYPEAVNVPDGRNASKEEMVAGQQAVKAYMTAMEEYLDCLDSETNASGEEPTEEQRKILVSRHNAAVDEMETLAASFNEQVRAYRAANPN